MDTITTIQSLSASNGSAQPVMVALTQNELRLIAAAPDLLALALQYRDDMRHPPSADSITRRLAAIDAAITKATGTT